MSEHQKRVAKHRQILGMDRGRRPTGQPRSIEREVDQYLNDPEEGTSPLEFWQVRLHFIDYI
jgi:hypothetical protein